MRKLVKVSTDSVFIPLSLKKKKNHIIFHSFRVIAVKVKNEKGGGFKFCFFIYRMPRFYTRKKGEVNEENLQSAIREYFKDETAWSFKALADKYNTMVIVASIQ